MHGAEVDFIIEINDSLSATEIKASRNIGKHGFRGFKSFSEFFKKTHTKAVAYMGREFKIIEGVKIFPWQQLLKKMGL